MFSLSHLNLNAAYWDIFWPQVIQGAAMAFLFIPLMAASMSGLPREKMGKRHQHLQPDAEHRWQLRHRHYDHLPGPP